MYKRIPVSGKYRFQRGIIVLAAVLWLITGGRILSKRYRQAAALIW